MLRLLEILFFSVVAAAVLFIWYLLFCVVAWKIIDASLLIYRIWIVFSILLGFIMSITKKTII